MDVLPCMVVTFAVLHLEMSALNTEADQNAVEEDVGAVCGWHNPTKGNTRKRRKSRGVSEWIQVKKARQQKKEGGVDVLLCMFVTAPVSHFEMSALNAVALKNAVGGCRCRGEHNPKINKIVKT